MPDVPKEKNNEIEFPYKEQFIKRMKYAREWLDLGEVEMGMNKKPSESNEHVSIMIDVFDVEKDRDKVNMFMDKLIK